MTTVRRFAALFALLLAVGLPVAVQPRAVDPPPAGYTIAGVDAHDGMIYSDAGTYYLAGTSYGCGFTWGTATTFCGFAVYSAPAKEGPWTFVRLLFPVSDTSSYDHTSWQHICGDTGVGCFNPRMVRRGDGVWILWFNSPYDEIHYGANGYYAMGCNGPAGPCGAPAGAPNGSTNKPALWKCNNSGDFSIIVDSAVSWIICNTNTYGLATEKLDTWWANGTGPTGPGIRNAPGLTNIEGEGAFKAADGTWIATFSDPACAYCNGVATGYAVAPDLAGPWTSPAPTVTIGGGDPNARRKLSASSCGGQPRTVVTLDGQPYQLIDLWLGVRNETAAGIRLEPLITTPPYLSAPAGTLWSGGLKPFGCAP